MVNFAWAFPAMVAIVSRLNGRNPLAHVKLYLALLYIAHAHDDEIVYRDIFKAKCVFWLFLFAVLE